MFWTSWWNGSRPSSDHSRHRSYLFLFYGGNQIATFTLIVILGILMILGGISLISTPLITFMSAGYFIVILFFAWGIYGIAKGSSEKRYDKDFFFSILSLILGIVGIAVPGIAEMNNSILLYIAAGWFLIHGMLSIVDAIASRKECGDTFTWVIGILLGVVELITAVYTVMNPVLVAHSLGILIGLYFIESGVNMILAGAGLSAAVALSKAQKTAENR